MEQLKTILEDHKLTIASAESVTAGLFCAKLAECNHASNVLKGGVVVYCNQAKHEVLGVPLTILEQYGAISEACVEDMAKRVACLFQSDLGIAFSGNAGPEASDSKPVGLCYMCIYYQGKSIVFEDRMQAERNAIREALCVLGANRIKELLG
ncbi:MAG: CinA family protein [Erysipelotrichaceae bacterium]